jgi:O-methyltransferase
MKRQLILAVLGVVRRIAALAGVRITFAADGLVSVHNTDFIREPRFAEAYRVGAGTGHAYGDLHIEWRVRVILWAAQQALRLPGDFVECGTNTGIYARAMLSYLDIEGSGKQFYLLDTFDGIPDAQMTAAESAARKDYNAAYFDCWELVQRTFAPFSSVRLIRGAIPGTLDGIASSAIAFASIDLNVAQPEIEAITFLWDRLVPGAIVVIDDYGWPGHEVQKEAWDRFVAERNHELLPLPTGQALLIKQNAPA